jgi:hypothetical protein
MKIVGLFTLTIGFILTGSLLLSFWSYHPNGSLPSVWLDLSLVTGIFCLLASPGPLFAAGLEIHRAMNYDALRTQTLSVVRKVRLPKSESALENAPTLLAHH